MTQSPAPFQPTPPVDPGPPPPDRPGLLQAAAILTLIDGILNLMYGLAATGVLFCTTIICAPLGAYPLVLGILEIIQASKLMANPPTRRDVPVWLGVMQVINVLFGNALSLATGIVALLAGADDRVKAYLADHGRAA